MKNIHELKLSVYGFSGFAIKKLLNGKSVVSSYGKIRYNKDECKLTTTYDNGEVKEEIL